MSNCSQWFLSSGRFAIFKAQQIATMLSSQWLKMVGDKCNKEMSVNGFNEIGLLRPERCNSSVLGRDDLQW